MFNIYYVLIIFNLALSLITSNVKNLTNTVYDNNNDGCSKNLKIYPENYVSLLSKLLFWWINPLIHKGKTLTRDDLWQIENKELSESLTGRLEFYWTNVAKKYLNEAYSNNKFISSNDNNNKASAVYKTEANKTEQIELNPTNEIKGDRKKIKEPSLGLCLVKAFGGKFLAGSSLKLLQDCLLFVGPNILLLLIDFVKDKSQNSFMGYFYTILLLITSIVQTFALQHYFHRMSIVGIRMRSALMNLVYKKSLRLSISARKQSTIGQMVNLLAVDCQIFMNLTTYVNMIWSGPLQISVCMFLLWRQIGIAAIAGLVTMCLFIPLNVYITYLTKKMRQKKLKVTDTRIKSTNELLNGIKIIKFYGWELSFYNIVSKIRKSELIHMRKTAIYSASSGFVWSFAPILVSIVSFTSFILIDKNNKLEASVAFVCISLFNILRFPLSMLPMVITALVEANVSLGRIKTFLLSEEKKQDDVIQNNNDDIAVKVIGSSFNWNKDVNDATLSSLNFEIKKGQLVAVIGSVGSGKSSLLSALLSFMHKLTGECIVNGTIAYVPQQAWIQNATLKSNILFGKPFDEHYYMSTINACALVNDLKILQAGDLTEIGEKGINLSGGQKARVSLARAVYSNADLYMLDDPLSAVDAHVSKHIFDNVIGPNGLLKSKTRVLVTNSLNFLPQVDLIIMLDHGKIVEIGNYNDLKKSNGTFSLFIKSYLKNYENTKENFKNIEENSNNIVEEDTVNESRDNKLNNVLNKQILNEDKKGENEKKKTEKNGKLTKIENIETGSVKMSIIIEYLKSCKWYLTILFLLLHVLTNVSQLGSSLWLSDWTNKADLENNDSQLRYKRLIIYASLGFIQSIFTLFADWTFIFMFLTAARLLHDSMLNGILRSPMKFFEQTPIGRILNRFSKDLESIETVVPEAYKSLVRCLFQILLTVIIISMSTPLFLIPLVPIAIVYVFCQRFYVSSTRQLKRLEATSKSPIFSHFSETLNGVNTISAYKAENRFIKQMQSHIDENMIFMYPNVVSLRWLAVRLEFIGTLISFFASLFAIISRNTITPGIAGLSISFSLNISQTLNWMVRQFSDFEANITSVERIKEYSELEQEAPWEIPESKLSESWPERGHIQFIDYSVKYRDELDVTLKHISFEVKSGEKIGIVGRTGAGKSTLSLALFRILENSTGKILIDDVDIKTIGLHDLRKRITIIPQDPILFSGTLKMNIDPFNQYTDEQIWESLEKAHLKTYVLGAEKQLLYECTEGGENISVGQRQLICLARALLRKSKVIVLDEATASVDHNTDELIQSTIRKSFSNCTIFTIAHRLNTIMDSNRIMVLNNGEIAEFDSPTVLLSNRNSLFYSLTRDANN